MTGPRPVLRYGNPVLRAACVPADPGSPAVIDVLTALWSALDAEDGVGLAAPQIGVRQRILVVRTPPGRGKAVRLEMVNPRLTGSFGPQRKFEEGCLSFPGLYLPVIRPAGVEVEYFDRDGNPRSLRDRDLLARIVQHEMDHLDGGLFIDRVSRWRRFLALPRLGGIRLSRLVKREAVER